MVDFNNEATIGTPAANIVKILILQARANVFEALESYNIKNNAGVEAPTNILKARLGTWFLEHKPYLDRILIKEDKIKFEGYASKLLFNQGTLTDKELQEIIFFLNKTCDDLRLTRIDFKRPYDKTDIEEDNKQQGFF